MITTFPFHTHTVSLITIEADPKRAVKSSLKMKKALMGNGYWRLCWLGGDEIWAHNTTQFAPEAQSRVALCSKCGTSKRLRGLVDCKFTRHCESLADSYKGRWAGWDCSKSAKLPGSVLNVSRPAVIDRPWPMPRVAA